MSVMMRNGVQYAGVPDERLDSLEEIVGDGQQSVGSDLTDAVTELNSSLTNIQSVSAQFLISHLSSSSAIYAYKLGRILFVGGYINSTQSLSRGVEIARISVNPFFETFDGPVNNTLTKGGRFALRTSGILQTEETIDANQWYSFSFVTLIR